MHPCATDSHKASGSSQSVTWNILQTNGLAFLSDACISTTMPFSTWMILLTRWRTFPLLLELRPEQPICIPTQNLEGMRKRYFAFEIFDGFLSWYDVCVIRIRFSCGWGLNGMKIATNFLPCNLFQIVHSTQKIYVTTNSILKPSCLLHLL